MASGYFIAVNLAFNQGNQPAKGGALRAPGRKVGSRAVKKRCYLGGCSSWLEIMAVLLPQRFERNNRRFRFAKRRFTGIAISVKILAGHF
jgi:hypothetical protein